MPTSKKRKKNGKAVAKKVPEVKPLICPNCETEITNIEWRPFADGRVQLVGCSHCRFVLGTAFNFSA